MKSIVAECAPGEAGENRGLALMVCPVCGIQVRERDLERYYKEGETDLTVELCTNCREDFEGDSDVHLDADVQPSDIFKKLWAYANVGAEEMTAQRQGLNERTAPLVAIALGGDTWQNGEGLWLVIKRASDGRVVIVSETSVIEYETEQAFEVHREKSHLVMA